MKLSKGLEYNESAIDFSFGEIAEKISLSKSNYDKLRKLSLKAQEKDNYVGNYFSLNVADGYAYYQVVEFNRESDKYLVKICRGICLDEWVDNFLGESRWADGEYVRHNVDTRIRLEKLFS